MIRVLLPLLALMLPHAALAQSWGPMGCGPVGPSVPSVGWPQVPFSSSGATLTVIVDDGACEVWFRGLGDWRKLGGFTKERSIPVECPADGRGYVFRVKVRWPDGTVDEREVTFRGGESPRIAFWLAHAANKPKFGLIADKLGKPGDPPKFESHGSDQLFEGPSREPKDDAKQLNVTLWSDNQKLLDQATQAIQPYADRVKVHVRNLSNPNVRWASEPFKLEQDPEFQRTRFKATIQGPLDQDLRAKELDAVHDPNEVLKALRKVDPNYDPKRSGGGLGLPPWLAQYADGVNWEVVLVAVIGIGALVVIANKRKGT